MLKAVSKAYFRIWSPETALGVLQEAARVALSAPSGPVSVEIPIDVQEALVDLPASIAPLPLLVGPPDAAALDAFAEILAKAKRPIIRSEEHTSELQSLMRITYAVFCLKNNKLKLQL